MKYFSQAFNPSTLEHAKNIVLTPDKNKPDKFTEETNFFVNELEKQNIINQKTVVLDFGCGMGRNSKALIEKFQCNVFGTDININMLKFATIYVDNSKLFVTCNRININECIDVVISCFVLQHVEHPTNEILHLYDVLKPNGYLVLVNHPNSRFYPSGINLYDESIIWHNDNINVFDIIEKKFKKVNSVAYGNTDYEIIFYQKT